MDLEQRTVTIERRQGGVGKATISKRAQSTWTRTHDHKSKQWDHICSIYTKVAIEAEGERLYEPL